MLLEEWITDAGYRARAVLCGEIIKHINGYVRIPKSHPLCQVDYDTPCDFLRPLNCYTMLKQSPVVLFVMALSKQRLATPETAFVVHGGITFCGENQDGFWYGFDTHHYK